MVGRGDEQHVRALEEVPEVVVVGIANVLQVAGDDGAGPPRNRQQVPGPVGQVEQRQPRSREHTGGQVGIDGEPTVPAAVVEVDPGAVGAHQVDAAGGAGGIDAQPGQVDPVAGKLGANPLTQDVVADVSDERRRAPEGSESPTGVSAGLPEVVDVRGKLPFLAEAVDQVGRTGQKHVGVDPDVADDNNFGDDHV